MNEVQALNVLTNLANKALNSGLYKDMNESGTVYTALIVLSQLMPPAPEGQEGHDVHDVQGDPQGDSE